MAQDIVRKLHALAGEIDALGSNADELIETDKDIASHFRELLKIVPTTWKKTEGNRLFTQIKKQTPLVLEEKHRKVIWSWSLSQQEFCSSKSINDHNDLSYSNNMPILDPIIGSIKRTDNELVLSSVRWRILLLLIKKVKDRLCGNDTNIERITTRLLQFELVSTRNVELFKKDLPAWLGGGTKYDDLSSHLGGHGSLVYLPAIGRSNYEKYYYPGKESGYAITGALSMTVTNQAAIAYSGKSAHDVVDEILQSTTDRLNDYRILEVQQSNPHQSRSRKRPAKTTNPRRSKRCQTGVNTLVPSPSNVQLSQSNNITDSPRRHRPTSAGRRPSCGDIDAAENLVSIANYSRNSPLFVSQDGSATGSFTNNSYPPLGANATVSSLQSSEHQPRNESAGDYQLSNSLPAETNDPVRHQIPASTQVDDYDGRLFVNPGEPVAVLLGSTTAADQTNRLSSDGVPNEGGQGSPPFMPQDSSSDQNRSTGEEANQGLPGDQGSLAQPNIPSETAEAMSIDQLPVYGFEGNVLTLPEAINDYDAYDFEGNVLTLPEAINDYDAYDFEGNVLTLPEAINDFNTYGYMKDIDDILQGVENEIKALRMIQKSHISVTK